MPRPGDIGSRHDLMESPPAAEAPSAEQLVSSDATGASTASAAFATEKSRRVPQRRAPGSGHRKSITWSVVNTVKYIANSISGRRSSQSAADIAAAAAAASATEPRGSILRRGSHTAGDAIIDMLKDESLDLMEVISAAQEEADSHTPQAIDAATAMRHAFGRRGKASVIVITNRTAAKLKLVKARDKVKSEIGYVYERCSVPQTIGPGKAASFLHVTDWSTTKGTRGTLTYAIHIFSDKGGSDPWVDSGRYLALQWDSNKKVKSNASFSSAGAVKHMSNTGTRYDGTKICGTVVNRESPKRPVYEFSFSHMEIEEGEVEGKEAEGDLENTRIKSKTCIVM